MSFSVELFWGVKPYFRWITTIPLTLSLPKEIDIFSTHLEVRTICMAVVVLDGWVVTSRLRVWTGGVLQCYCVLLYVCLDEPGNPGPDPRTFFAYSSIACSFRDFRHRDKVVDNARYLFCLRPSHPCDRLTFWWSSAFSQVG